MMQSVPASYFRWLWNAGKKNDAATSNVADYIKQNLNTLQQADPAGSWDKAG